jgi:anaerobic selenocysteine-containing dehydrogenase
LRSEVAIVTGLARELFGADDEIDWESLRRHYDLIRDHVSRVVPGFADFNARVRSPDGFQLPHGPRDSAAPSRPPPARPTSPSTSSSAARPRGRAAAADRALARPVQHHYLRPRRPLPRHQAGPAGRLRHPTDLAELGLADGRWWTWSREWSDGVARRAPGFRIVSYPTAKGCAAAYFPETNVLVPLDSTAETSNTPTSKSIVVRLEPHPNGVVRRGITLSNCS